MLYVTEFHRLLCRRRMKNAFHVCLCVSYYSSTCCVKSTIWLMMTRLCSAGAATQNSSTQQQHCSSSSNSRARCPYHICMYDEYHHSYSQSLRIFLGPSSRPYAFGRKTETNSSGGCEKFRDTSFESQRTTASSAACAQRELPT